MSNDKKISIEEALKWFAEIFEEPLENLSTTTSKDAIEGWDSLGTLTLMAELDERFNINLNESQLEKLVSINDVLNILKEKNLLS